MNRATLQHAVLYKRSGHYAAFPVPRLLADGRLAVLVLVAPFADHFGLAERVVLISTDQGETFVETDDPTIPFTWPATTPRECYDRYADILPDGTYLATGTVGVEVWPKIRQAEAEALGLSVRDHPNQQGEEIVVGMPKLFVQQSHDQGRTWTRREWLAPGFSWMVAFPRWTRLHDGTLLLPVYARNRAGNRGQTYVWRSNPARDVWRLLPMASSISDVSGGETCFLEVEPGKVLAHIRHEGRDRTTASHLLESWSEDGGRSWSQPVQSDIKGYPPHLLRLQDGRLLCTVGYRWEPMGIRAVLSADNGKTWETANTLVLRDDGGPAAMVWPDHATRSGRSDVGYPVTIQFPDGSLFTSYYITLGDGLTHAAATRWHLK